MASRSDRNLVAVIGLTEWVTLKLHDYYKDRPAKTIKPMIKRMAGACKGAYDIHREQFEEKEFLDAQGRLKGMFRMLPDQTNSTVLLGVCMGLLTDVSEKVRDPGKLWHVDQMLSAVTSVLKYFDPRYSRVTEYDLAIEKVRELTRYMEAA